MARRITAGLAGAPTVGALQISPTAILTSGDDVDITVDPEGAGLFVIDADTQLNARSDLRFADADSSNWVAFEGAATIAANVTWTLPAADGTSDQVLTTNGAGVLSWTTKNIEVADEQSSSSPHFVTLTTVTSGEIDTTQVSENKLQFQPSTGTLTVAGTVESYRSENVQTTNYTLALTDRDKVVTMNSAGNTTVTVPPNSSVAFPIGSVVYITRIGTGTVTLAAGSGVTLSKSGDLYSYEEIMIRKRATDSWQVVDHQPLAVFGEATEIRDAFGITTFSSTGSTTAIVQ